MEHKGQFIAPKEEVAGLLRLGMTRGEVARHYNVPRQNIDYIAGQLNKRKFVCEECGRAFPTIYALSGHLGGMGHMGRRQGGKGKKDDTTLPINHNGASEEEMMSKFAQYFQNAVTGYKKIPELEKKVLLLEAECDRWKSKTESLSGRLVKIQQLLSKPN